MGKDKQQEMGMAENPFANKIETADGLPKIEALQEDPNEEVYQKAMKILEKYFPLEAIATRVEAIALRLEAIATRLEAIAIRLRPSL